MATPAGAAPLSTFGVDATQLGVRAGGGADQSNMLQSAIDQTAGARVPLMLGPGEYRVGGLQAAERHPDRRRARRDAAYFHRRQAHDCRRAPPTTSRSRAWCSTAAAGRCRTNGALVDFAQCSDLRIIGLRGDQTRAAAASALEGVQGTVSGTTVSKIGGRRDLSRSTRAASTIQNNTVRGAGNGGILVHRSAKGDDGTLVIDNRIEDIANVSGGSGQYGNAINVFRAGNVIVRGNRISRAAYSAVRGNSASNIQITGNTATDLGEVAIYSEFGFEGAVIANNTVDGAALGIVVCNFNEGGRLAVVQGNLIRNLKPKRPIGTDPDDAGGVGIAVEADASVTGNVDRERARPPASWSAGAPIMRDVSVVGNVVRDCRLGIAVSVVNGAGTAVITGNLISGPPRGAIVGMDHAKAVTGDLSLEPARYANLQISANRVR